MCVGYFKFLDRVIERLGLRFNVQRLEERLGLRFNVQRLGERLGLRFNVHIREDGKIYLFADVRAKAAPSHWLFWESEWWSNRESNPSLLLGMYFDCIFDGHVLVSKIFPKKGLYLSNKCCINKNQSSFREVICNILVKFIYIIKNT